MQLSLSTIFLLQDLGDKQATTAMKDWDSLDPITELPIYHSFHYEDNQIFCSEETN